MVKHNHFLGKFALEDIPPGRRGSHKFRVTFGISDEGILTVSAFHVGYGSNEFNLTIDGESGRLTEAQIKEMLSNADQHKEQDLLLKESLAAKAKLEQYTFQLQAYITDPILEDAKNDSMEVIEDQLSTLTTGIDTVSEFVASNPSLWTLNS